MRRVSVKLFLLAAVITCGWVARERREAAEEPASAPADATTAPTKGQRWMGVATCASMACHHANGPNGGKRSEYSTWVDHDKHAQAYQVLYNERSQTTIRNLLGEGKDVKPAHEQFQCLLCHATANGEPAAKGPRFTLVDSVGCESCHGPAEKYLAEHYRARFRKLSETDKWEKYGLRPMKNLTHRFQVCADCHIGNAKKGMEVNHDLLAAGHPRLNFEYSAYLASYPKHWDMAAEKTALPDYEARAWVIGQLGSAKTALELLQTRAQAANAKNGKPWPEFSEYACFACHRDLKVRDMDDDRGRLRVKFKNRPPGTLPWGTWYYAMTVAALPMSEHEPALAGNLGALRKLMEAPSPDAAAIAKKTSDIMAQLSELLGKEISVPPEKQKARDNVRRLLERVLRQGQTRQSEMEWDEITQLYLACDALSRALQDVDALEAGLKSQRALEGMRRKLNDAFEPGFASPNRFDRDAEPTLGDFLKMLRERLE